MLNVLRHYGMIPGTPDLRRKNGTRAFSTPLLAPASGLFVAEPGLAYQQRMPAGALLARIVDVYGDVLAELRTPVEGMIFGLRALPTVQTGDWCCFYAQIEGEL